MRRLKGEVEGGSWGLKRYNKNDGVLEQAKAFLESMKLFKNISCFLFLVLHRNKHLMLTLLSKRKLAKLTSAKVSVSAHYRRRKVNLAQKHMVGPICFRSSCASRPVGLQSYAVELGLRGLFN